MENIPNATDARVVAKLKIRLSRQQLKLMRFELFVRVVRKRYKPALVTIYLDGGAKRAWVMIADLAILG